MTGFAALAELVPVAVLVVLATAGTVWLVRVRAALEEDTDSKFWYIFTGLVVVVPTLVAAAVLNRAAGAVLAVLAAASWIASDRVVRRRLEQQAATLERSRDAAQTTALAARQNAVLLAWSHYELDPAASIDFPAMSDVGEPKTAELAKALAAASRLQAAGTDPADYGNAVARLEQAFRQAETAACAEKIR